MTGMRLKDLIKRSDVSESVAIEGAKLDFALSLVEIMERNEITRTELADRLSVSRPMVTKILRGDANLTIETMVRATKAVFGKLEIRAIPESSNGYWMEVIMNKKKFDKKAPVRKMHDRPIVWEQGTKNGTESVAA